MNRLAAHSLTEVGQHSFDRLLDLSDDVLLMPVHPAGERHETVRLRRIDWEFRTPDAPPALTVTSKLAINRQIRSRILSWISPARVSRSRFTKMAKRPNRKDASPEPALAEEQIEAIKTEIGQAMIQRNMLPKSASDEEKAAAAARVEQLQAHGTPGPAAIKGTRAVSS